MMKTSPNNSECGLRNDILHSALRILHGDMTRTSPLVRDRVPGQSKRQEE
jgi:hypothetical protein